MVKSNVEKLLKTYFLKTLISIVIVSSCILARAPRDIPGEEVTEEEFLKFKTVNDTSLNEVPKNTPDDELWYDKAAKTWTAPSIADQLDASESSLKGGMGGIFVPYMSDPEIEPEMDILNLRGKIIRRGKCGKIYNVLPGEYFVHVGSGSKGQRVIKKVQIVEGKVKIIKPDWCGITINVIDENNKTFRGEYEIARIDTFDAYGRGTGNDPTLGELLDTWIVKPGLYKIFNVGASYTSLKNFVTIRLLPGEYVQYTLVEDNETQSIIGGGAIDILAKQKINSNWSYGIDIGGGIDFNVVNDRIEDTLTTNQVDVSLLFEARLAYLKEKLDWDIRLRVDEGINVQEFNIKTLSNSIDLLRLSSVLIWRLLPILGPYQRFEGNTEIFPTSAKGAKIYGNENDHYFIHLKEDKSLDKIDGESESIQIRPAFSPLLLEAGLGISANVLRTRIFDATIMGGLGYTYEQQRDTYRIGDSTDLVDTILNSNYDTCYSIASQYSHHILIETEEDRNEVGPELLINTYLRLGRMVVVDSELKYFLPFKRIKPDLGPDLTFRNTVSLRLISQLTLDYEFRYALAQPEENDLRKNEARHRVLLRFSFSRR